MASVFLALAACNVTIGIVLACLSLRDGTGSAGASELPALLEASR